MKKSSSITIKDIARELEISVSTVSRALADNPIVKHSTREAVQQLAKKYRYTPNYTALSLQSNQTKTIAIVIPQLVHEFFSQIIRGIEDHAYGEGYNVLISSTHESYEREIIDTKALISGRVDGVLACISKETTDFSHFHEFKSRDIPLVLFDCACDDIEAHKVILDDFKAGYEATLYLITLGRKNIAYVGGPRNLQVYKDRFEGYKAALKDHQIEVNEEWICHCETGDFEDGMLATKSLFQNTGINGLFAATDMMAIGAMKNIKAAKLNIPNDVAVIGFSNWKISEIYEPSLTTMSQPGYDMGKLAAKKLLEEISGNQTPAETIMLKSELIARESTGVQPVTSGTSGKPA